MKTTFEIPLKRLSRLIRVDWDALPETSKEYVIMNGLKQSLNDAMAGADGDETALGLMEKRLDAILEGTMGVRRVAEPLDPIAAKAFQMARLRLKKAFPTARKEDLVEKARQLATDPRLLAHAKRVVEEERALAQMDLGDVVGL